jgi:hypothetical protein
LAKFRENEMPLNEMDYQFLAMQNKIADLEFSGELYGEVLAKAGMILMFGTAEEKHRLKNILSEFIKVTGIDKRD